MPNLQRGKVRLVKEQSRVPLGELVNEDRLLILSVGNSRRGLAVGRGFREGGMCESDRHYGCDLGKCP